MNDVKAQASRLSSAYKGILMGLLFLPYMRDVTIADLIIHALQKTSLEECCSGPRSSLILPKILTFSSPGQLSSLCLKTVAGQEVAVLRLMDWTKN